MSVERPGVWGEGGTRDACVYCLFSCLCSGADLLSWREGELAMAGARETHVGGTSDDGDDGGYGYDASVDGRKSCGT